ncbi:C-C motif chemokine 4-like [Xyrichtys novacula]|uniref:C-C motif chemokine 4-like n=1 Tax=Xyrichtys novacula TaxID=13765 RepID=A0AAV1F7R3_XYRNO|nr:C-C motif chemokine 4-like [Xyrichtys novacula]
MKTLCFTLGLLLLIACSFAAIPEAVLSTAPGQCCFKFSDRNIPKRLVMSIIKTHSSCENKAFIVQIEGKQICFKQTSKWANHVYKLHHTTEGSSQ